MASQTQTLINRLATLLPEGLVADSAWLRGKGYSSQLQHQYVTSGWLEKVGHGVFRRPPSDFEGRPLPLTWQQVVVSLQTLMDAPLLVLGGRSALEVQGYSHYLRQAQSVVHLYGAKPPPTWVSRLKIGVEFAYHNDKRLFADDPLNAGTSSLTWNLRSGTSSDATVQSGKATLDPSDWPLTVSTPERAILEFLDDLPTATTFDQVDAVFGGLGNLRPLQLQKLLSACRSVKVKRLFLFFADRHQHAWLKRLDKSDIDLGSGKRMLVKGGILDRTYQITVPGDLDAVR